MGVFDIYAAANSHGRCFDENSLPVHIAVAFGLRPCAALGNNLLVSAWVIAISTLQPIIAENAMMRILYALFDIKIT